ncbi:flavodoxin [Fibrobacterales bacterium]|nr:flavodoxin [Fibrobacterales bacterium]
MNTFILSTLLLLGAATANAKTIVAYFSHSGNTRAVAEQIQKSVGGDIFEIKTVVPYSKDYNTAVEVAKKEQQANARPELSTKVSNMEQYDTLFLGYPNWWGTIPMPLFTFLESYDFAGKVIVPFCTHGGSALGRSEDDIAKLAPKAKLLNGLAIRGGSANNAQKDITAWLKKIGILK